MIQKDYSLVVNSVDLSSSLVEMAFDEGQDNQEATAHGDDWRYGEPGLRTGVITADFKQSYTSGGVDDTISGLMDGNTYTLVWKPTSSSVSSSNPSFTATVMVESYNRAQGPVGDLAICRVQFSTAAGTGFVRAEA